MKRFSRSVCIPLFALLLLPAGCGTKELGPLKDVSRPYAGVYACEELLVGGNDLLGEFETLSLELGQDGGFVASYETKEGTKGSMSGGYTVDTERGEIAFTPKQGTRKGTIAFPYEEGRVLIDYDLGGALLHAEFALP